MTFYVGVSTSRADAVAAVERVGADVYLLGEASSTPPGGAGNTAVFAYQAPQADDGAMGMWAMSRRAPAPSPARTWAPTVAGEVRDQQGER